MNVINAGIVTLFNNDADLVAALTGGLHYELAKQSTSEPYGTFNTIIAVPIYDFTHVQESISIQFDLYALTNASRKDLYTKLTAVYDDSRPTATGYTSIIMERVSQQFIREGDQNQIYRAIVRYKALIEKAN